MIFHETHLITFTSTSYPNTKVHPHGKALILEGEWNIRCDSSGCDCLVNTTERGLTRIPETNEHPIEYEGGDYDSYYIERRNNSEYEGSIYLSESCNHYLIKKEDYYLLLVEINHF